MTETKCPLKVFLCHIIPLWDAHGYPFWAQAVTPSAPIPTVPDKRWREFIKLILVRV